MAVNIPPKVPFAGLSSTCEAVGDLCSCALTKLSCQSSGIPGQGWARITRPRRAGHDRSTHAWWAQPIP